MKLLYIGYWGVEDNLTVSTVIPHLKILSSFKEIDEIIFCSMEREGSARQLRLPKVKHIPLFSRKRRNVVLTKIVEHFVFAKSLKRICRGNPIDLILCRSALAGAFGHYLGALFHIPYIVESFEPHAGYMVESGVWKWYDLRTIVQRYHEAQQKGTARYLCPVSNHYAAKLMEEGIDSARVRVLPCCVDTDQFRFDESKRMAIRARLDIPANSLVGIYVGKFGGIYYYEEAFKLYKSAFDFFGPSFRLILLSGHPPGEVNALMNRYSIPAEKVILLAVLHDTVNEYMSASDFAFCTIKPAPSRIYCSPIKNAEYWANGLPVLLEAGIGDDSDIVAQEGGGHIIDPYKPEEAFHKLAALLTQGRQNLASSISALAIRHRSMNRVAQLYKETVLGHTS